MQASKNLTCVVYFVVGLIMWGLWITRELLANCQSEKRKVASLALPAANIHRKFPCKSICQLKAYMNVSGSLHMNSA